LLETLYNTKYKYYNNRNKIISLIYSEAVCITQEGFTANGIKKKSAEIKNKRLSEEIKASNCNLQNIILFVY